jgi:hypothetical protein
VQQPGARHVDGRIVAAKKAIERVPRDQPAIEKRGQAFPQPRLAQLGEQQRDIRIGQRQRPADPERAIE